MISSLVLVADLAISRDDKFPVLTDASLLIRDEDRHLCILLHDAEAELQLVLRC